VCIHRGSVEPWIGKGGSSNVVLQGNVDPVILFASEEAVEAAVRNCVEKAGTRGHILNLGHGVLVGTPEERVGFFFDLSKKLLYAS
jgi:uroporphyrinogen decarboxylase